MNVIVILGISFIELFNSRPTTRTITNNTVALQFIAWGSNDENDVNNAFGTLVGLSWDGLPLSEIDCTPQGGGVWSCVAKFEYTTPDNSQNNDNTDALGMAYAVDLSAGQAHITQSLETISTTSAGVNMVVSAADDTKVIPDGIGVSADDVGAVMTILPDSPEPWSPGDYTIEAIDLMVGTWKLDTSPAPVNTVGGIWTASTGPNYSQAIGVTNNSVAGTDIFLPKFEFSVTVKTYPVTLDFLRTVLSISAHTNNDSWKGFDQDSVLYLGMTGQAQPEDFWTLTHKFAVGQNKIGLVVTPSITLDKKAWEYLWCAYGLQQVNGLNLNVPRVAKVERVYDSADFNLLLLNPPVCDWTSIPVPASGVHPLAVVFVDLSTGTPISWFWTFGDGTTSNLKNPAKVYAIPGVYTVSLTVGNGAGSSFKTVINYVTVS